MKTSQEYTHKKSEKRRKKSTKGVDISAMKTIVSAQSNTVTAKDILIGETHNKE